RCRGYPGGHHQHRRRLLGHPAHAQDVLALSHRAPTLSLLLFPIRSAMSHTLITASYLLSGVLFILSLGGLSKQETAKRGNAYGMLGMALAIATTALDG